MRRPNSRLAVHAVGAASTALVFLVVILVKTVVEPELPSHIAGSLFLLSVVFSAWYGGMWPGLFTAALSYLVLDYFFLPPVYSLGPRWEDLPIGGIYLLLALVVSTLQERRRRAEETLGRWKERMLLARSIQVRLLPQAPPSIPGFDIVGALQPAEETGGDCFDFISMPDGNICVVVGDVSGHGFPAALLMAETRAYLRALALGQNDVSELLTLTNAMLLANTNHDCFVTMFIAYIHPTDRVLGYAGAGHDAFLLHANGRLDRLHSTAPPLGVEKGPIPHAPFSLVLEEGDVLAIVTDGIIESHSQAGEQFGIDRTIEAINVNRTKPALEIVDRLAERVRAFSSRGPQEDDMTAVIVKVSGQGAGCNAESVTGGRFGASSLWASR
jgi:sigma-B regulation protein RsbU (phosphoserine phosphatase)